ncbi:MAG: XRE family transcriptional regulator, partial [Thermomicrobia bacterium]|nr:XRE family transcriptional regulator [Thermomicrobia bacterium]
MGMREFGTAIRTARIKAGISQKMLADRVGLSRESISNYERGEVQVISPALLEMFAATLGIDAPTLARVAGYLSPGDDPVTNSNGMKTALITGITGQDGTYLAEFLVAKGYKVYGMVRGQHNPKQELVQAMIPALEFVEGDLLDQSSLIAVLEITQPDEVYNLGAISFVPLSWKQPVLTGEVTGLGVVRMLEAIRMTNPRTRFYQASSSEMFGKVREVPQTELTPFAPRSPYGFAKAYGHYATVNYRESYGMFACSGILFNHESPRRGLEFVTRKITNGVARIVAGKQHEVVLGDLQPQRDWGYAGDYVRAMWAMLQQDAADDYVVASGGTHTIEEFATRAFAAVGLDWHDYVRSDPKFYRPAEVNLLIGKAEKAERILGWSPTVDFPALVGMMVEADLAKEGVTAGAEPH